jgi:hypothetical protein
MGRSTVLVVLSVLGPFAVKLAHLSLDHAGVTTVPPLRDDFVGHFPEEELIMIFMIGEGEKNPVSISWTG